MQRCTFGRVCSFVQWSVCVCLVKWALLIWDHRWHGSHSLLCVSAVEGSPAWLPDLAWCSRSLNARLNSCFCVCYWHGAAGFYRPPKAWRHGDDVRRPAGEKGDVHWHVSVCTCMHAFTHNQRKWTCTHTHTHTHTQFMCTNVQSTTIHCKNQTISQLPEQLINLLV